MVVRREGKRQTEREGEREREEVEVVERKSEVFFGLSKEKKEGIKGALPLLIRLLNAMQLPVSRRQMLGLIMFFRSMRSK